MPFNIFYFRKINKFDFENSSLIVFLCSFIFIIGITVIASSFCSEFVQEILSNFISMFVNVVNISVTKFSEINFPIIFLKK